VTRLPPPLRFLAAVIGGWACVRAALLAPAWWPAPLAAEPVAEPRLRSRAVPHPPPPARPVLIAVSAAPPPPAVLRTKAVRAAAAAAPAPTELPAGPPSALLTAPQAREAPVAPAPFPSWPPPPEPPARWSVSAWSFVRRGDGAALATGGTLGGSQAGIRATYRLAGALAASARVASPLGRPRGAEAALGLDWRLPGRVPLHLLAERRQKLGREGRSAFGITLYGGADDIRLGPLRLDAYGQAGAVGARRRDLFADGAARLSLPLGRLKLGIGAWAAAQPGAARVDIGPQLALPLPGRGVTLAVDWRRRIAGQAAPGSGPALTVAAGF
jgi:hypothetical protein